MFDLFGITFYWYGILIGLGVWMAMEISLKNRGKIDAEIYEMAMVWTVLSGILGARIYHVVDYWNRFYSTNFEKVFFLWDGGLGIWGAIIGGAVGLYIFCLFNKIKYLELMDSLVIGIPLAQTIGRIGNLVNGELSGKNGEPLWAYEGVMNLILFGILWKISRKTNKTGVLSGVYLLGYGVIRVALENFRPDEVIWKIYGVPVALGFGVMAILFGLYLIFRRKQS